VFVIVYGWRFALVAGRNVMTGVGLPSFWLYLACPILGVALCLMEAERLINFFDRRRRGVTLEAATIADDALAMKLAGGGAAGGGAAGGGEGG
jgi:TRAP-type C4-dicarboxylate transport system permease small subunit